MPETQPSNACRVEIMAEDAVCKLIRYVPSGAYFARIRVGGKLIRQSLKTKVLTVAKLRLAIWRSGSGPTWRRRRSWGEGDAAFRELVKLWRERMEADQSVKRRTKTYYAEQLEAGDEAVVVHQFLLGCERFVGGAFRRRFKAG